MRIAPPYMRNINLRENLQMECMSLRECRKFTKKKQSFEKLFQIIFKLRANLNINTKIKLMLSRHKEMFISPFNYFSIIIHIPYKRY